MYQFLNSKFIADAAKSGVAQETLQNAARRAGKVMTEQEARQILGVSEETAWEEIMKARISFFFPLFCYLHLEQVLKLVPLLYCRSMTFYLRRMPRMGASTFNQRLIELSSVLRGCLSRQRGGHYA